MNQNYHFIAIGGAVMHQLAIYLHQQGNSISGSDDVIFDPAKSNLAKNGLLPEAHGWFEEKIHSNLDGVILGMHAKPNNPELNKALALGLKIYSFPEFIYHHSKNKTRLVVAGSHGKTSITSMIMHILRSCGVDFDYLVGSSIKGFETMVRISDAPIIILEGDEYLSSPLDNRSKFLHYFPHISIISGIAWDHINVFPTFEGYLDTFSKFISSMDQEGKLIYYKNDDELQKLVQNATSDLLPYEALASNYKNDSTEVLLNQNKYQLQIFGQHNMENANAAILACVELGIPIETALKELQSFEGAAKRLEAFHQDNESNIYVYRDFAHAPSKLKASLNALREKYAPQKIVVIFELHTFSSLQENFLPHYKDCLQAGDEKVLFLDKEALKIKNRPDINDHKLLSAFNDDSIQIIRSKEYLEKFLEPYIDENTVYAFMSSGNFGGFNLKAWINSNFVKK